MRGLIGIRQGGIFHGTYNHFDSYPEGLGDDVVAFAKTLAKPQALDAFREKARAVEWVVPKSVPTAGQIERYSRFADEEVSSKSKTEWYVLLRDVQGAAAFERIADGSLGHVIDNSDFVKDSLFCEYAYVLDLDRAVLEFYRGFQKKPQADNPFGRAAGDGGYYPIAKVGEKPFTDLAGWKRFYPSEDDE